MKEAEIGVIKADDALDDVKLSEVVEKLAVELDEEAKAAEDAAEAAELPEEPAVPPTPGFDLAKFRYSGPWPEKIPAEGECFIFNNPDHKTAKDLLTGNTQPVLAIGRAVWDEIQYLVKKTPGTEMAMFLVLKQFSLGLPKYLAVDLFFPKQEVGSTGVSIDAPSVEKFYSDLGAHEDYKSGMHRRICHLHSHASMGCFWSAADNNQQLSRDDLGFYDDFRFYVVVNVKNELRCSFVQYKPFLRRFDNLPVVVIGKETELPAERRAELDSWVSDRTSKMVGSGTVFSGLHTFDASVTEEYGKAATLGYTAKPNRSAYVYQKPGKGGKWSRRAYGYNTYGKPGRRWSSDRRYDDYDLDYHDTGAMYDLSGGVESQLGTRPGLSGSGIAGEFVDFCVCTSSQVSAYSDEDIDEFVEELKARSDVGVRLAKMFEKMSRLDRHDAMLGFSELVSAEQESFDQLAELMVAWVDWLERQSKNLEVLRKFLRQRY